MTNDEKLSEWGECFHSQTNVCGKAISWPCASVFSEHPSLDYLGRYVLPPPTPRRHNFHSAAVLLLEMPCLADLRRQGVVRREVENSKIYRGGLRIYPHMSFGAFETFSPKGRIWGLELALGAHVAGTLKTWGSYCSCFEGKGFTLTQGLIYRGWGGVGIPPYLRLQGW